MGARVVEVLVAGGGPAGATVARLLALKGRRVLLIDPAAAQLPRLEVLPPAALGVTEAVGLIGILEDADVARPCLGIRRQWGQAGPEWEDFLAHPHGKGFVIDRTAFDERLRNAATAAGVEIQAGRVRRAWPMERNGNHATLVETSCESCSKIVADIAIDATGRPAALARRLGADQLVKERLVAELLLHRGGRWGKCTPGWLYILGEPDSWTYRVSGPHNTLQEWRIARRPAGPPQPLNRCVDASPRQLSPVADVNWLAIGDAALSFDPITSQGLFNALSTALIVTGILQADTALSEATANYYSACIQAVANLSESVRKDVYASLS